MEKSDQLIFRATVVDQRNKARHWKFCHYDASRYYRKLDSILGLSSVILSTIILGSAFYSINDNIPMWIRIMLASMTVTQGILLIIQLYMKPAFLAERHKASGAKLGALGRGWVILQTKIDAGIEVQFEDIENLMKTQDGITNESDPIPNFIMKKKGVGPKSRKEHDELITSKK